MLRAAGLLSFVFCAALTGQQDVVDLPRARAAIVALLESPEPVDAANGAYQSQRLRLPDLVPQLRECLRQWTAEPGDDSVFVRHYVLDALIQLQAELPGEEVAPQLVDRLDPLALILMARDAKTHASLLFALLQRHWQSGDSDVRLAAGNLLATAKAPGFAMWLMRRLPLRLHVTVRDIDPAMMGVGTGGAGASSRTRVVSLPAGFPPLPHYRLTTQAVPFAVLLASGHRPVYFERSEDERRGFRMSERRSGHASPWPDAHRWLLDMARADERRLGLPLTRFELLRWHDSATYVAQVSKWRAEMEAAFADLARRLVIRGAMTKDERDSLPVVIGLEIDDERVDRKVALPDLPVVR